MEGWDTLPVFLANLNVFFQNIINWVGGVVTTIVDNPILLLTTGFLVVGGAIGIFGRLLSKN